jgi:cellobiose phosphorylase
LVIEGSMLTLSPCLPAHWPSVTLTVRRPDRVWVVVVTRAPEALRRDSRSIQDMGINVGQAVDLDSLPEGTRLVVTIPGGGPGE